MKKLQNVFYGMTLMSLVALFAVSCSTDNESDNPNGEEEFTQAELKTVLETDEISGAVDVVLAEMYMDDGSSAKGSNECYAAEYTETGYVAVFNNCLLNGTDNINGTLVVEYATESQSAVFTATFEDFYVGDIKVNGTRTYAISGNSEQNSIEFSVTSSIELMFADETIIEENGTKAVVFTFGQTLESSTLAISGNWTLEVDGNTYVLEVTEDLIGNFGCSHLVSGLLYVGKNGLAVTIDFGDGTCDDQAEIVYPDDTREDFTLDD